MIEHEHMELTEILSRWRPGSGDWDWITEWADVTQSHRQQVADLTADVKTNGITTPVLLGDDGRVWDGHKRLLVAMLQDVGTVPVEHGHGGQSDGPGADLGPQIVALTREVDRLRQNLAELTTTERCCTRCGNGDLYPRRCSQCGQRWADMACGPTHALIAEELGVGDVRRMRTYLAEQLGHPAGEVPPDEELLRRAATWIEAGLRAALERRDEPGRALTKEELIAEFEQRKEGGR